MVAVVDEEIEMVMRYLENKHCTLWGDWYIDQPKERRRAALWLFKELQDLTAFAEAEAMAAEKAKLEAALEKHHDLAR